MRKNFLYIFTISVVSLLLTTLAFSQDNNRAASAASSIYVISAKAGGVNYVEGKVAYSQNNGKSGYLLKGDSLEVGDKVMTGAGGKAEILLNPGSYARLGENTSFEFKSTSLDDLRLQVNRGSAIFEVITDDDFNFVVSTPKANFNIVKSGIYRVDVLADGSGKIAVWKGKAEVGGSNATEVKGGREATVNQSNVAVEKFDRDEKDALETWSKDRAKELAKANSRLERNDVRNTLINSFNNRGWNMFDSYGLWLYNRYTGGFCFLPFGYGWNSPYGYGFGRDLWYMRLPRFIYYYQPPTPTAAPNNTARTPRRSTVPPYQRVDGARRMPSSPDIFSDREAPSIIMSRPVARPVPPAPPINGSRSH